MLQNEYLVAIVAVHTAEIPRPPNFVFICLYFVFIWSVGGRYRGPPAGTQQRRSAERGGERRPFPRPAHALERRALDVPLALDFKANARGGVSK